MKPEITYVTGYEYPEDLPAEDRVIANARITRTELSLSPEELVDEKTAVRMANILQEIDELKADLQDIKAKLNLFLT